MKKFQKNNKKIFFIIINIILIVGLCVSIGFNIYHGACYMKSDSYLQDTEEIYIMESGILRNNLEFYDGTDYKLQYNFLHENYEQLKKNII